MKEIDRVEGRGFSRRSFLASSAKISAGLFVSYAGVKEGTKLFERFLAAPLDQLEAERQASVSNRDFIERNRDRLANIRLGSSFSPEEFRYLTDRDGEFADPRQALGIVINELGIRDIRLGTRWSEVVDEKGEFDLRLFDIYYVPFIDYCIENGVEICLNVGPIKTFRYPEDHVPQKVLDNLSYIPLKNTMIDPDLEMAEKALNYLNSLLSYISSKYRGEKMERIKIVQPENEPFNHAGRNKWALSHDYLLATMGIINKYFPKSSILINSDGEKSLEEISDFFKILMQKNSQFRGRLISGIDFYHKKPGRVELPVIGQLDPITWEQVKGDNPFRENIERSRSREAPYKIEVTELQNEPWGSQTSPGNSASDLRFIIQRSLDHLIDPDKESVLRIWGIEMLVRRMIRGRLSKEQTEITDLITKINFRSSD